MEDLRKRANKTRVQVGREVGVTERNIYDWENGKFYPRLDRAVALARSLGVSFKDLCIAMGIDVSGVPDIDAPTNETADRGDDAIGGDER